jgi:hypothetical protein
MRWPELGFAGAPAIIATPFGAPWPVVLVLEVMGLLAYGWVQYLRHKEHMLAIGRTADSKVADVMRAMSGRDVIGQAPSSDVVTSAVAPIRSTPGEQ